MTSAGRAGNIEARSYAEIARCQPASGRGGYGERTRVPSEFSGNPRFRAFANPRDSSGAATPGADQMFISSFAMRMRAAELSRIPALRRHAGTVPAEIIEISKIQLAAPQPPMY